MTSGFPHVTNYGSLVDMRSNSATFRRQVSQGNAEVSSLAMSTCKVAYG
jgi:hypothetical protein